MAGIATFLTMAYITVVNPIFPNRRNRYGFRCIPCNNRALVIGTLIMGLWAQLVALAMVWDLMRSYISCYWHGVHYSTSTSGCICSRLSVYCFECNTHVGILLTVFKRMKLGVGAGIGLFAIIGLKNAGVVVDNPNVSWS